MLPQIQFKIGLVSKIGSFRAILVVSAVISSFALLASGPTPVPVLLFNTTPSEPEGWYLRSHEDPRVGRFVAFSPPASAQLYVATHMKWAKSFLKQVAASSGDRVCIQGHTLTINGAIRGPVQSADSHGDPLPQFTGCRRLLPDELFVFSDMAKNGFDSRYFGPVRASQIIGVFRLLHIAALDAP